MSEGMNDVIKKMMEKMKMNQESSVGGREVKVGEKRGDNGGVRRWKEGEVGGNKLGKEERRQENLIKKFSFNSLSRLKTREIFQSEENSNFTSESFGKTKSTESR